MDSGEEGLSETSGLMCQCRNSGDPSGKLNGDLAFNENFAVQVKPMESITPRRMS